MRIALDANVYVGAQLSPHGICLKVIKLLIERLENLASFVPDLAIPLNSCRDPKDLIYLAAADTAKADLIVSLDNDFLDLTEFRGIKILKPHEFMFIADQIFL